MGAQKIVKNEDIKFVLKCTFCLAQQVYCRQECQATLLLRSADLPGDGQHQGEDGAEPDLRLDQGTVCFLPVR